MTRIDRPERDCPHCDGRDAAEWDAILRRWVCPRCARAWPPRAAETAEPGGARTDGGASP